MNNFSNYVKDLEDTFCLDCSNEDLATNEEAKRCYKYIKKYRKQAKKHNEFLCKFGFIQERSNAMKNNNTTARIGLLLFFVGVIVLISATMDTTLFHFKNPDMTELRLLMEHPAPAIASLIALVSILVGKGLISK